MKYIFQVAKLLNQRDLSLALKTANQPPPRNLDLSHLVPSGPYRPPIERPTTYTGKKGKGVGKSSAIKKLKVEAQPVEEDEDEEESIENIRKLVEQQQQQLLQKSSNENVGTSKSSNSIQATSKTQVSIFSL